MSGIFDWLFGSNGSTNTGSSTTTNSIPQWLQDASQGLINSGTNLSQNPYSGYTGNRIENFSPDQQAAFSQTRNAAQSGQPWFNQALQNTAGLAANGTPQWSTQAAQQYMSPYTNTALQSSVNMLNQQRDQGAKGIQDASIRNGSFGGARQGVQMAEYNNNYDNTIANTIAQGQNTAYNNAQTAFNNDQNRNLQGQLGANNLLGGLANSSQQAGLSGANAMQTSGAIQQALGQQGLDLGYQNFTNQQMYPYNQLNFLGGLISGVPYSTSSFSSQSQANPSVGQSILGYGLGAASLANMFGAF